MPVLQQLGVLQRPQARFHTSARFYQDGAPLDGATLGEVHPGEVRAVLHGQRAPRTHEIHPTPVVRLDPDASAGIKRAARAGGPHRRDRGTPGERLRAVQAFAFDLLGGTGAPVPSTISDSRAIATNSLVPPSACAGSANAVSFETATAAQPNAAITARGVTFSGQPQLQHQRKHEQSFIPKQELYISAGRSPLVPHSFQEPS